MVAIALLQCEEIVRPEFFNRFGVSLARFYEVARQIAEHEGGDVKVVTWSGGMQHLSAQTATILSEELIIDHHRERSMKGEGRYSTSQLQSRITAVTAVTRQEQHAPARKTMKILNTMQCRCGE